MNLIRSGVLFAFLTTTVPLGAQPPAAKPAPRELHVVSVYEGVNKTDGRVHGGKAVVKVDRPGKLVTLVLSSYEPVTWEVSVAPNSQVGKVVLGGYYRQAVKGLPKEVEVVEAFREEGQSKKVLSVPYSIDSGRFRPSVQAIRRLTDQEVSSFQGKYSYDPNAPFVVERVQDDARLRSDYPLPTPAAELPKLDFKALYLTSANRFQWNAAIGDYTLAGPKADSLQALPRGVTRVTMDPETKKYYGIAGAWVVEVDLAQQTTTRLDGGLDVPRISLPCGIAFDTKRQRLVVVTFAGVGYMYAYSPKSGKWSVLRDMNNLDLSALVYHPKEDVFYGLDAERDGDGEGGRPTLYRYNAAGALLKKIRLGEPTFPGLIGGVGSLTAPPQVIAADGYLVLMAATGGPESEQAETESFLFLVDPTSEKVRLTWRR